jgi:predicted RNA-binding Zn-ribbon protein involved in translation (DUF1610 family)
MQLLVLAEQSKTAARRALGTLTPGPFKTDSNCINKSVMHLSRERHSPGSGQLLTAQDPLVQTAEVNFICPHCGSFYEVVKATTRPESVDPQVTCLTCTGPLPAREAQFVLKYFLFRKANRGWHRTPVGYQSARM